MSEGRPKTELEFSSGAVAVRGEGPGAEVVVIVPTRPGPEGKAVLALPKGHPEEGEKMVEAARRELREETGIEGEPVEKLGDIRYWYRRGGRLIHKKVSFYLFRALRGDVADHDHEIEEARWMPLADAVEELSFEGERDMAARALARLNG